MPGPIESIFAELDRHRAPRVLRERMLSTVWRESEILALRETFARTEVGDDPLATFMLFDILTDSAKREGRYIDDAPRVEEG